MTANHSSTAHGFADISDDAIAAIDFGISNTDAVYLRDDMLTRWTRTSDGIPDANVVHRILADGGLAPSALTRLGITGGRHRVLPGTIGRLTLVPVNEVTAIGRGGQALGPIAAADHETPTLVVSAGSGTAVITARARSYVHTTGSAVGGGTLLGLGRLLLNSGDAWTIDGLAQRGDANGADLSLKDVISGPIGSLPPDATAVNFGRLAQANSEASREDLAAALVTLVGQVIAITAINAARAERVQHIVVIGHLTDLPSFRAVLARVGLYYGTELLVPVHAGYGTAIGALLHVAESTVQSK